MKTNQFEPAKIMGSSSAFANNMGVEHKENVATVHYNLCN